MAQFASLNEDTLGRRVQRLRLRVGLSLRGLATKAGVDPSWLSKVERDGYRTPDPRLLWQVAQALDVEVEELHQAAGYSGGLPGFAPYLRTKYQLPEEAVAQLEAHFQLLNDKYQQERGHPRADPRAGMGMNRAEASKQALIYLRVSTAEQAHAADAVEGYSIPAQRDACQRKATELGATVIAEFTDRGESARTTARPQLRAMLDHLATHAGIDYVIVHKVDRLARNRADDVEIQLAIERAGARLVSVSESVDDTPSGRLVRNIMSDLAEFYSANLAVQILKGTTQKARVGGTPHLAPLGYLNVRRIVDGHEERTIGIDEERAPHICRAFELYATGNYSLRQLLALLTADGLTARPTSKSPARPLSLPRFAKLLRGPYYTGLVTYRGVTYPGKHPPLVSPELFATVGRILDERDQACIKQRRHQHYLRGLLTCRRCGSRLMFTVVTGKTGAKFGYYVCGARHRGKGCTLLSAS